MTKILVIEDETAIRENILDLLDAEEFEVMGAENGRVGVEVAQSMIPDLIICDVMMPDLDGYGVLESLRSHSETSTIPFIFLTAKADKSDARKGMDLGADDYLTKPCSSDELLRAIATRLEKQAKLKKLSQEKLENLRKSIAHSLPHELRTPLNGIMGCTEIMLNDLESFSQEEIREMLESILISSKRLYRLIQNFLLYAELELVSYNPQTLAFLRQSRLEESKKVIEEQAIAQAKDAERSADLYLELKEASVNIAKERLQKIIEELLDNALKFSPINTPIHLTSDYTTDTFTIKITDQGRGMTAEQITNIGAYMQFERKLYEQQGSGLGLVVAKHIIELYDGTLTIESEPEHYTTITVCLPKNGV
ncbi:MAG: hybrid sensor histidine kinase/response regulator [Microcoleaceae cyanobacterium]